MTHWQGCACRRDILPKNVTSGKLSLPNAERIIFICHALQSEFALEEIFNLTNINRRSVEQIKEIVNFEGELEAAMN